MIEKNNVSALNQLSEENLFQTFNNAGKRRFLFVGNSITRHGPKPEIGWENDWGMAASKKENDYVHVTVSMLEKVEGEIDYCIVKDENMAIGQYAHGGVCLHPNDEGMRKIAERIVCAINNFRV